jgi:hypothetical protein
MLAQIKALASDTKDTPDIYVWGDDSTDAHLIWTWYNHKATVYFMDLSKEYCVYNISMLMADEYMKQDMVFEIVDQWLQS